MTHWLYLLLAILAEVVATSCLKASDGFSQPLPSVITVLGYACSFFLLSLTLRAIPVGIAYAIWSGVGVVLVTAVAWWLYGQKLDLAGVLGIGCIIIGVIILNLYSKTTT